MTTLQDGATAFAKAHPLTPDGTSWKNGCARLAWDWCASFTPGWKTGGDVSTAAKAMKLSDVLFPVSVNDIIPGRLVWLSIPGNIDGHVGFCVAGQGLDALIFWATDVLQIVLGNFIGFGTVRQYEASSHHGVFVGVSEDYAGAVPNLSTFAGGGVTPVPDPTTGDDDVNIFIRNRGTSTATGNTAPDGPGAGGVVLSDTNLSKWIELDAGYPELLAANGVVASANYQTAPNLNVAANVFGYLKSLVPVGVAGSGASEAQVQAISDNSDKNVEAVIVALKFPAVPTAAQNGAAARAAIVAP